MLTSRNKRPLPGWRRLVFVSYVALMLMVFLLPMPVSPPLEATQADKLGHFAIFAGFALLFWLNQQWSAWRTLLVAIVFAGVIELVQSTLPHRQADWVDFLAGAAGAGLGIVLAPWILRQAGWWDPSGEQSSEES